MARGRAGSGRHGARLVWLTGAGFLLAAVLAGAALAAVTVTASSSQLGLSTPELTTPGTNQPLYIDYDLVVEPYSDAIRTGYRVRPREGVETGKIDTTDGDCFRNPAVNDVVCSTFSTSIEIDLTASGDDDRVAIRENQRDGDLPQYVGCYPRGSVTDVSAVVRLGRGNDSFSVRSAETLCGVPEDVTVYRPYGLDLARLEVRGGTGDDTITGGWASETKAFGESGNDEIVTRSRADDVDGGTGSDTVSLGKGNDRGVGGTGNDSVTGADGHDNLQGQDGNDALVGGAGNDTVDGGPGNDSIAGDAGVDQLRGGPGSDVVNGGDGDDLVWLDDDNTSPTATPDEANCGAGRDTVYADSVDNVIACERVIRHWYTDGLPAYVRDDSVSLSSMGGFALLVRCPPQAGVRCTGTLTVRVPGTSALVGQEGYDLGVGREAYFGFQIRGARPATVQAATSEQGQTQPRSATVIVALT